MTTNKDFKRLVRARMAKTGERYSTARAQLLRAKARAATPAPAPRVKAATNAPAPSEYATIAGMSDAAVKAKTGCGWQSWVKSLDRLGAHEMTHAEIAKLAREKFKAGPWWGQMVAVGYERIKGLRARGQQRSGTYNATRSRTFAVSVGDLFDAWNDAKVRKRWMPGEATRVRSATRPKAMRLEWLGGGVVTVAFTAKGAAKSAVAIEQLKLPSAEAAAQVKAEWGRRFDALGTILSG